MITSWFKFPVSYWHDPRMFKLRKLVGDDALWLPARMWTFAVSQEGTGDLSEYSSAELAEALRYRGHAKRLRDAFTKAGYIDKNGRVVGWKELYALAASRKRSARTAAKARWAGETLKISKTKAEKTKEGRGEADALRDASSHTHSRLSGLRLTDTERAELAKKFRITIEGVVKAEGIFREIKMNYPKDPQTPEAFSGWLRASKPGKEIRGANVAPIERTKPKTVLQSALPEPDLWAARLWGHPDYNRVTGGITDWLRLTAENQTEVMRILATLEPGAA